MNSHIQIVSIMAAVLVILLVAQLIRSHKLREEYAILWLGASIVLFVFAAKRDLLDRLASAFGIAYSPSLLLLGTILMGFFLSLHFSISLSRLAEQNKRLAQEVAILKLASQERSSDQAEAPTSR
jgi:hypothetical protein